MKLKNKLIKTVVIATSLSMLLIPNMAFGASTQDTTNSETLYPSNSVGFFNYVGSKTAASMFKDRIKYTAYDNPDVPASYKSGYLQDRTNVGRLGDATTLENMYHAIGLLEAANSIRRDLHLKEYLVSDNLMALTQINANWSFYGNEHFNNTKIDFDNSYFYNKSQPDIESMQIFYRIGGANLAWNANKISKGDPKTETDYMDSPYYLWFYNERDTLWALEIRTNKDMDGDNIIGPSDPAARAKAKKAAKELELPVSINNYGHYLWIIKKDHVASAIAYAYKPDSSYQSVSAHMFISPWWYEKALSNENMANDKGNILYTVPQYKARLDEYADHTTANTQGSSQSFTHTQKLPGKWIKDYYDRWWFQNFKGGYPKDCFATINGVGYRFDNRGYMVTGWQYIGKSWYYFKNSGAMAKGWQKVGGKWYYLKSDGKMASNEMVGEYYVNKSGAWTTGHWVKSSNGKWWYSNKDGTYPANQFKKIGSNTYYFDNSGWVSTGWRYINSSWSYFNKLGEGTEGAMVSNGWKKVAGKWYYFYKDGKMASDTMVGSYYVNKSGAWESNTKAANK